MSDQPHDPGQDRITAIPRTPASVFLHWDLGGPAGAEAARAAGPEAQWVLRVADLSDGTSRTLPLPPERRSLYVDVTPGRVYGFELAVRGRGRWRTVCRTARVQMPPAPRGPALPRTQARPGIPGLDLQATFPPGSSLQGAAGSAQGRKRPASP